MTAPQPALGGRRPAVPAGAPPRWCAPEVAWPIAVAAGFAGTWLGLVTRIPGLAPVLAGLLFAPLYVTLFDREERTLAALCSVGWALGIAGAVVGTALESSAADVAEALPGAEAWIRWEVRPWLGGGAGEGAAGAGGLVRDLAVLAVLVLSTRPALGLLSLLGLAWSVAVVFAGAALVSERSVERGLDAVSAVLQATPPHAALALVGALLVCAAFAGRGSPFPLSRWPEGRRRLAWGGAAATLLGAVFHVTLRAAWGQSLGG